MHRPILQKVLAHKFLKASLIPILTIEILLLALYFGVNSFINQRSISTLLNEIRTVALPIVINSAEHVDSDLQDIARHGRILQNITQKFYANPEQYTANHPPLKLQTSSSQTLYKSNPQGCGVVYIGKGKGNANQFKKINQTEYLDPFFESILKSTPNLAAVYINTHDNMNRMCPYVDGIWDFYPKNLNIPDYNFYYEADQKHNPTKGLVWTDVYLDPAGQGWMASALVPIYKDHFLEGVVGLDVTVDKMTKNILNQVLPWDASIFLVNAKGTILAMPPQVEEILGLKELKEHVYNESVSKTILKPENYNLITNPNKELAQKFKEILTNNIQIQEILIQDKPYLFTQAIVKETNWRLILVVDKDKVLHPIHEVQSLAHFLGYAVIVVMILFYVVFFNLLYIQAKNFSHRIAKPVEQLVIATGEMGTGRLMEIQESGIYELDLLSDEFKKMQGRLKERTEALVQERVDRQIQEERAQNAYQAGLFESTSAYLHNVGNAMTGIDGHLRNVTKLIQSMDQWPQAYDLIVHNIRQETINLEPLERLKDIQLNHLIPKFHTEFNKIQDEFNSMLHSIDFQQKLFKDSHQNSMLMIDHEFNLHSLVEDLIVDMQQLFTGHHIRFENHINSLNISANQFQFKMGLLNLLKNACESVIEAKCSEPCISIFMEQGEDRTQIMVQDNGVGFLPEVAGHLFQQGFSTKQTGHGLGLHSFMIYLKSIKANLRGYSDGIAKGATFIVEIKHES